MIKHVFINQKKLAMSLKGDAHQVRQPIGYCYIEDENGKPQPHTMFVGTERDDPTKVKKTAKGDIQFNVKPSNRGDKKEVEAAPEPSGDTQEEVEGQELAARLEAEQRELNMDIPF